MSTSNQIGAINEVNGDDAIIDAADSSSVDAIESTMGLESVAVLL